MPHDPEFVEYVVREVVRRLLDRQAVAPHAAASQAAGAETQLRLEVNLITVATLQGKLNRVEQVILPRRCVVTPAALDELKQRKIVVRREA